MEWLERTGLDRVRDGLVREFSRGMRQRLAVARAFLHDPTVLLLDEPFTALDDRAIAVLQSLLRDALAEGRTIVISTHQLREALELATHVALLDAGQAGLHRRAHGRKCSRIRDGFIGSTGNVRPHRHPAPAAEFPAPEPHHRLQGPALRAAHQGGAERLVRLLAGHPAAVQLRLRSDRGTDAARFPAACCGWCSPSPAR